MEPRESHLVGCYEIKTTIHVDSRGRFIKVFNAEAFKALGLETEFKEEYYTNSREGVIRGMHFQTPPSDHVKMVYCVYGEVLDVVLDLRTGSQTYGKCDQFVISAEEGNCLYIPKGLAHGFLTISPMATLVYKVSSVYDPGNDTGVLWDSFGFSWPVANPILSARDRSFKSLSGFESPF